MAVSKLLSIGVVLGVAFREALPLGVLAVGVALGVCAVLKRVVDIDFRDEALDVDNEEESA